MTKARWFYCE